MSVKKEAPDDAFAFSDGDRSAVLVYGIAAAE
jgi:uncharacterized Rossmann fold enzyme